MLMDCRPSAVSKPAPQARISKHADSRPETRALIEALIASSDFARARGAEIVCNNVSMNRNATCAAGKVAGGDFSQLRKLKMTSCDQPVLFELKEGLRERGFGEFNGGPAACAYKQVWKLDADATHTNFGCESVSSVLQRVCGVAMEIDDALDHSERWHVVLVSHGDTLQILQTAFEGIDPKLHRSLPHLNTAELRMLN